MQYNTDIIAIPTRALPDFARHGLSSWADTVSSAVCGRGVVTFASSRSSSSTTRFAASPVRRPVAETAIDCNVGKA